MAGLSRDRETEVRLATTLFIGTSRLAGVPCGRALAVVLLDRARMARSDRPSTRYEIFIGRSLAICAHPVAAWRTTVRSIRLMLVASYFAAAFVTIFGLMALLGSGG